MLPAYIQIRSNCRLLHYFATGQKSSAYLASHAILVYDSLAGTPSSTCQIFKR
ncbi:hypothetical protein btf_1117 [Dehalococcoides mccartyi BTF08]|nr:hypothetical protein btf_1117 [Dehalococcoides mccartyi BTF08]